MSYILFEWNIQKGRYIWNIDNQVLSASFVWKIQKGRYIWNIDNQVLTTEQKEKKREQCEKQIREDQ